VCTTANSVRVVTARRIRWAGGICGTYRKGERFVLGFVGRPEARRVLGIPKRVGNVHWIDLARDRESGGLL